MRCPTVREFVSEFRGLSGTAKGRQICDAIGASRLSLAEFYGDGASDRIGAILSEMAKHSSPIKPRLLGAIGKLSFKVRGAYFVIVTISFAEVTRLVALNWVELTQGPLALTNIPPYTLWIPGIGEYEFWNKTAYYYLVAVVGLLAYVIIKRLVNSRIGRAMIALKENESLASSVGIDVTRYLVLAAVVSAAMAGAAGSLYAHYVKIIDPDIFLFIYTVTMVIMVITGGKGTLAGPIVGGVIFGFTPVIVRSFAAPAVQWILYGALMIVIVFVLPRGIVPAIERWAANWRRSRGASDAVVLAGPKVREE